MTRLQSLENRVNRLELLMRPQPRQPAPAPAKWPRGDLSVAEIVNTGRQFIGWAWHPTVEEIQAIQGGAMVCFTESDGGAAFVSVQGMDPRPLPAFRNATDEFRGASPQEPGKPQP